MNRKTAVFGAVAALASAAAVSPAISAATADQTPASTGPTPGMMSDAIALHAMPRGTVRFLRDTNGDLAVKLAVTGLTPSSQHNIDVERGACPATFRLGADVVPAAEVTANAGGQVNQTIDLGRSAGSLPQGPLALTIRQGLTANVMDGGSNALAVQGLACAQVPHQVTSRGRSRKLDAVSESGKALHGWASYAYNATDPHSSTGHSVTVTIKAYGFVPGSVHAAHVHAGSCTDQGNVVVMLPDLKAKGNGEISASDTVDVPQQPQGPLYINIHEGNSTTILTSAGTPTLAFRPLLCGNISQTQTAMSPTTTTPTTTSPTQTTPPSSSNSAPVFGNHF